MTIQIIIVLFFTFIIQLINTLAYSIRIVGIRTGKIAVSFALFNVFALIARTSNTLQGPLLAKTIEDHINYGTDINMVLIFRVILLTATFASIVGIILIPTFQRLFSKAVMGFDIYRSVPKLLIHSFSKSGISHFKNSIVIPSKNNFKQMKKLERVSTRVLVFNMVTVALLSVGVLSSLYAGVLEPTYRTTSSMLTSVVTGFATILLAIFIDPYLSIMTDDVIGGRRSESDFRINTMFIVVSRILGTILAQLIFLPSAKLIAAIARII